MVDPQPLASWNVGASGKSAILDFVARVTKPGGAEFAPPAERIAVFDNDGTLCCEQPLQIQFYFAFGRVRELVSQGPSALAERQPFPRPSSSRITTRSSDWGSKRFTSSPSRRMRG